MNKHFCKSAISIALCIHWLMPQTFLFAQSEKEEFQLLKNYQAEDSGIFSSVFGRFRPKSIPKLVLENSPRIDSLIQDGKLHLTLTDALALALENNLDIAVQRYIPEYSQTDLLRTKAGQSPRGFTGGTTPGGLTSGALGAGVSGSGTGSGVGSAGGITGGGGAIQVGSSGSFDPSLNVNFSYDHVTSPLNTSVVSGIYNVIGKATAFSASYAQLFSPGTSVSLTLSGQRQSSTQRNLLYNPASVTRFALGVNQPLLNGFGKTNNQRYILVARNNTGVAEEVFRLQVISTVVSVENAYWDLAAMQESVKVAERALAVAQQLHKDNRIRLEVGTMSPLDVTSAESEVAARTRDLTIATTNLQLQEATLKNMLVKRVSPELDAAKVVIKDPMPEPRSSDIPELEAAMAAAMESRPELRQAATNLKNQDISVRFTGDALKPSFSVFGFYAGAGLQGTSANSSSGLLDAFGQSFEGTYPEYAGGFSLSIPLRNRTAQADSLRSQIERNQLLIAQQRSRNTISMEVRKAIIGLEQGKAQLEAAHTAASLAREMWEGEKVKLEAGASTSYQVILRERDYTSARYSEVNAMVVYAKAMVEMDRAMGATLNRNGIEYDDALSGKLSKLPKTPFNGYGEREGR
ncbi:MAG: TolC family protein [Acidobacteriota bacterium]|nr:TolC family protein [Acidobacteriota bacterium]